MTDQSHATARTGRLITLDGVEGSGKSTQLTLLERALRARGLPVVTTREPGGTPLGEGIRAVVLDQAYTGMSSRAELFLYLASRAEHVDRVIRPALASGAIVLCDRFSEATVAYQAYGRGLSLDHVERMTAFAADGLRPDLVLILDVPVDEGLQRVGRRAESNRLDRETSGFHQRVRDGYLEMAKREPDRLRVFDGLVAVEALHQDILAAVESVCRAASTERVR